MAILDSFPHVRVSICSGDEQLKEYDCEPNPDAPPSPNTVVKYIESRDDAPFHFQIEKHAKFRNKGFKLGAELSVDGEIVPYNPIAGIVLYCFAYQSRNGQPEKHKLFRNDAKAPRFSKLDIIPTEDLPDKATIERDVARLRNVGELMVKVYRMSAEYQAVIQTKPKEKSKTNTKNKKDDAGKDGGVVMKAVLASDSVSHRISWGESKSVTQKPNSVPKKSAGKSAQPALEKRSNYLDTVRGKKLPIATYIFKYRSRAALETMLVIIPESQTESKNRPSSEEVSGPSSILKSTQDVETSTINVEELSPDEMSLLVLHNFSSNELSFKQLEKLAKKNIEKLTHKEILKVLERDPDDARDIDFDDLEVKELRLLAVFNLNIQALSISEIHKIAGKRLKEMTSAEVQKAIKIERTFKRERAEEGEATGCAAKKVKKSSPKVARHEIIELSD